MAAPQSLQLLDACVDYGVGCFLKGMSTRLPVAGVATPTGPDQIPAGFRAEIRVVAQRAIEALCNQVQLGWNARTYAASVGGQDGGRPDFEAILRSQFPPLDLPGVMSSPGTFVDDEGEIVLWYLPDLLLKERQKVIAATIPLAAAAIAAHPPQPIGAASASRWRHSESFYAQNLDLEFGRGMTTLSPGWLCQAQEGFHDTLHVSQDLGPPPGRPDSSSQISAQTWLASNLETGILLSVALAIAHPAQYRATRQALGYLATLPDFARHMDNWTFAFNVVTLICNRLTPGHRDRASGGRDFYDLLLTIGGGNRTLLALPGLGVRLQYDSGTAALFSGHQHLHEVSGFAEERACLACYARPPVIRWLQGNHPPPPVGAATLPSGWWDLLKCELRGSR